MSYKIVMNLIMFIYLDMYVNSIAMKYFQRLMISFISLAWVTAMASGTAMGFGIVAAILGSRFGSANIIVLGGVICAVGLFSSYLWDLFIHFM